MSVIVRVIIALNAQFAKRSMSKKYINKHIQLNISFT